MGNSVIDIRYNSTPSSVILLNYVIDRTVLVSVAHHLMHDPQILAAYAGELIIKKNTLKVLISLGDYILGSGYNTDIQ